MRTFVVVAQAPLNVPALAARIKDQFPDTHYALSSDVWLVARDGTVQEICDALKIVPNHEFGGGAVFGVDAYFGHAPVTLWDWMKAKWEKPAGG